MRYLLDTRIVSDLVGNPHGRITQRIREVGEMQICTSIIVAAELRYGIEKKESPRQLHSLPRFLALSKSYLSTRLPIVPMACFELVSNKAASRSARTIFSLRPKRLRSVMFLLPTTSASLAGSTVLGTRIGCVSSKTEVGWGGRIRK